MSQLQILYYELEIFYYQADILYHLTSGERASEREREREREDACLWKHIALTACVRGGVGGGGRGGERENACLWKQIALTAYISWLTGSRWHLKAKSFLPSASLRCCRVCRTSVAAVSVHEALSYWCVGP
jgi:hypothetical protein